MKKNIVLYGLWGCFYILCMVLGYTVTAPITTAQQVGLTILSLAFFVPPTILLIDSYRQKDQKGLRALRIISGHFPLAAICIALGASFQALGDGIYSTITSLCRQMLVLLPAAYLLSLSGEVTSVWWAYPIAEVMSLTVTMIFFLRIYRQKIKPLQNE